MLTNALIFIATFSFIFLLYRFNKKLTKSFNTERKEKIVTNFHFTCPEYVIDGVTLIAKYSATLTEKAPGFFKDQPVKFKFYSNDKFKATVKISYTIPEDPEPEDLMRKQDIKLLDGESKEYVFEITDIITKRFYFEIELHSHYGDPWIDFTVLPFVHDNMIVRESKVLKIRFPKIIRQNK